MKEKIMKENKIFTKVEFDEYQTLIRYKYGFRSFIILMALMLINASISSALHYSWSTPIIETFTLILVVEIYFSISIAIRGAFTPFENEKRYLYYSLLLLVIGGINLIINLTNF